MPSAAGRYSQLEGARDPFLTRARDASKLTIPSLVPPTSHTGSTKLYTPFQGIGARGLNNLAAKLLLALLPPNSPFFRLAIDDFALERMTQRPGMRGEVEKTLNKIERAIQTEIETSFLRVQTSEALKLLIVAGNVLLFLPTQGGMRVFALDRYVVCRDPMGTVLEIITKESVSPTALPDEVRKALPREGGVLGQDQTVKDGTPEKTVDLFTYIRRTNTRWMVHQEVAGMVIPGSKGHYPLDKCPWIPLRWTSIDGESYGRGYVEEYYGDLRSLEALSKAIVEGSAAAAKVLFLVKPNGTTNLKTLVEAPSGAVRAGDANDVTTLQLEKAADFRVAQETAASIEQRLSMAFMLNSAIQRKGERVTAEEIRYMAGELEEALGGVYAILSQEFQLPLVSRLMFQMERQGRLPVLPKGVIRPTITTGMEALGRGQDLNKLDTLMQGIGQLFGPEAIAQEVRVGEYIKRRGTALGIDMDGLIKSDDEKAQEQQQAQIMQLVQKLGPNAMQILRDQMDPANQQQGAPDAGSPPQAAQ